MTTLKARTACISLIGLIASAAISGLEAQNASATAAC